MAPKTVDRAAAIRAAVRSLVAEEGFHGASMSKVAKRAGVAAGTAYVHYASKDEIVVAAYVEAKAELGRAALADIGEADGTPQRFVRLWCGAFRHLQANAEVAQFLSQLDASPYAVEAHEAIKAQGGDPLMAVAEEFADHLADLPLEAIWDLGLAPAIRLAAKGVALDDDEMRAVAQACWRAIGRDPA